MPKKKKPIFRIKDGTGNAFIPSDHKKYRKHLESLANKEKEKIHEEKKAAQIELNAQRINAPAGGPFISGKLLLENMLAGFELFDMVFHGLQPYDPVTGEKYNCLEMPDYKHIYIQKEYPEKQKRRALEELKNCVYRVKDLQEFPVFAAFVRTNSDNSNKLQQSTSKPNKEIQKQKTKESVFVFKETGKTWKIIFNNKEIDGLKGKGFAYFYYLMQRQKENPEPIDVIELYQQTNKVDRQIIGDIQYITDRNTLKKLYEKLENVKGEIESQKDKGMYQEVAILEKEKESIESELGNLKTPGGRIKTFLDEKSRTKERVRGSMRRALERINNYPELYDHFHESFKPINSNNHSYHPKKKLHWVLD